MSKYTFLIFLFANLFLNCSFNVKEGLYGSYFIKGKAFDEKNNPIKSDTLIMYFRDKKTEVITTKTATFKVKIEWFTLCPSIVRKEELFEANNRANPEKIIFKHNDNEAHIINEWRKQLSQKNHNSVIKKDLHFK